MNETWANWQACYTNRNRNMFKKILVPWKPLTLTRLQLILLHITLDDTSTAHQRNISVIASLIMKMYFIFYIYIYLCNCRSQTSLLRLLGFFVCFYQRLHVFTILVQCCIKIIEWEKKIYGIMFSSMSILEIVIKGTS